MRAVLVAAVLCLVLALPGSCQTAAKNWKDRTEYDLANRITSESNPDEQLKLLLEWRRLYPASEVLQTDPSDLTAMFLLCSWAPRLKAPPEGAAALVKKAATELLARLDQDLPTASTRREMGSFFDGIETGKPARTQQVPSRARKEQRAEAEQAARQALEWAKAR